MKSNFVPITLFLFAALTLSPLLARAEEPDPDLAEMLKQAQELQKASEGGTKPVPMSELLKQSKAIEAQEKKREQAEKAALQKQADAPGPVAFPAWMPKVPDFTPDGPAHKKVVDEEVQIIQTGTSIRTPAELGDAWEAAKSAKWSVGRSNNSINDTKTVIMYLSIQEPAEKVRLEATRAPEEKITHISVTSPLPKPDED